MTRNSEFITIFLVSLISNSTYGARNSEFITTLLVSLISNSIYSIKTNLFLIVFFDYNESNSDIVIKNVFFITIFIHYIINNCIFILLILLFKKYNMLYFNLRPIFVARQIEKPYSFLVKIGIAPNTAHKILNNSSYVMRLDNLERICRALYCEPNDLLAFKPDHNNPLPKSHPLNNLIPKEVNNDWQQQLKTLPLSKLKEITEIISQNNNSKE